jgi:putative mRNA 3-end processing factor
MDYGVKIDEEPIEYPQEVKEKLNSILLTHAHLDHSGAVPYLYHQGQKCPLIGQEITRPFAKMLWYDSIKIAKLEGTQCRFKKYDVQKAAKKFHVIDYKVPIKIGKTSITSYDAGHIPGSSMFMIQKNGKKILYTGDFNTDDTRLIRGCEWDIPTPDSLITESTYAGKEHPDREREEKKLMDMINTTISNEGIMIISSFAIARSQEALLILENYGVKAPVYIDGMTQRATKIIGNYPHLQARYNSVNNAVKRLGVKYIQNHNQRKKILNKPCIIITTSGMLCGGAVVYYIKRLYNREDCSLALTGFQVPDTEGDKLLKTGRYIHEDINVKVKMNVKKFDFSAHASDSDLMNFIGKIGAKKIFCVHGENTKLFADRLNSEGFDAIAPSKGEEFDL